MPFPASGENLKLGKGSLMLAMIESGAENGFDFAGNANSISLSADITQTEIYSSTQSSGALLDRSRTRISYTMTVSLNEFTMANLKLFLAGTSNSKSQTSGTGVTASFADVVEGRYYDVGARQITNVIVYKSPGSTPLTLNTDYTLNAEFGMVRVIPGGAINDGDDITVEFDRPAKTIDQVRIATSGQKIAHVVYLADDANSAGNSAKDRLEMWRVDVAPDGELNFISDDYGAFNLTMTVLTDEANHPNDPYGTLDRITA